ncbi:MAG: hypothetical protein C4320_05745, partial [Armatimonadota bacterium]
MDDLQRQDRKRFLKGLIRWPASGLMAFGFVLVLASVLQGAHGPLWLILAAMVPIGFAVEQALRWSRANEFRHPKLRYLWKMCEERLARYEEAQQRYRKTDLPQLTEMPIAIHRVARSLRLALRRADGVLHEVEQSEGERGRETLPIPTTGSPGPSSPPVLGTPAAVTMPPLGGYGDEETGHLYRLPDRNAAEYREG